jgi:hypothetical protein
MIEKFYYCLWGIVGLVGRFTACDVLCCTSRCASGFKLFCPEPSGWLINQLYNPQFIIIDITIILNIIVNTWKQWPNGYGPYGVVLVSVLPARSLPPALRSGIPWRSKLAFFSRWMKLVPFFVLSNDRFRSWIRILTGSISQSSYSWIILCLYMKRNSQCLHKI